MPPIGEKFYLAFRAVLEAVAAGELPLEPLEGRALHVIYDLVNERKELTGRQLAIIGALNAKRLRLKREKKEDGQIQNPEN